MYIQGNTAVGSTEGQRGSGRLVVVHHKAVLTCTLYNEKFTYRNPYSVIREVRSAEGQRGSWRLVVVHQKAVLTCTLHI